jgi:hypothetical protein
MRTHVAFYVALRVRMPPVVPACTVWLRISLLPCGPRIVAEPFVDLNNEYLIQYTF